MAPGSITEKDVEIVDQPSHIESVTKGSHVTEIGTFRAVGLTPDDEDFYTNFPADRRKKVFRKVSIHIHICTNENEMKW